MTMPGRSIIEAKASDLQTIITIDLDLSIARNAVQFQIGSFDKISADPAGYDSATATTPSSTIFAGGASVRVGRNTADPIRLEAGVFIRTPAADVVWISNAAQAARMLRLYFCPPQIEIKFYLRNEAPTVSGGAYGNVSVGTTATLIRPSAAGRASVMVKNNDPALVLYVGFDSSVTTANGFPVGPGEAAWWGDYTGAVYGIAPSSTIDTRWTTEG